MFHSSPIFGQQHRSSLANLVLVIWLGLIISWSGLLIYAFRPSTALPDNQPVPSNGLVQPLIVTATSTPTPLQTTPTPILEQALSIDLPTPPAEGNLFTFTPMLESLGWTSSIDGRNHFGDDKIHSGFFREHVFHGGLQFDVSDIPPGSTILYASLELTGLNDHNLSQGGVWQIRLLNSQIDELWSLVTYDQLRQASVALTLQPPLPREQLAEDRVNKLVIQPDQLPILAQQLNNGFLSFRIDGPGSGIDNLFSWQAGSDLEEITDNLSAEELAELSKTDLLALTGQPVLKIVVQTLNYVIITSTPTPENILTVAAQLDRQGTPTPLPANWVTPIIVTSTPEPLNQATATYYDQVATAEAIVNGTATPLPANVWTATPPPVTILLSEGAPTTQPPTPTPAPMPTTLIGQIAFLSDRAGGEKPLIYVMDANGENLALLTDSEIYEVAVARDKLAADQNFLAITEKSNIYFYDYYIERATEVTQLETGRAYQPAWSPVDQRLAFVSNDSGADEIWTTPLDWNGRLQLTREGEDTVNRHPSWSPDGRQLVFWSNRTGKAQIWLMNADGTGQQLLHQNEFNDWNPVWLKYTDLVARPLPGGQFLPD